MAEKEQMSLGPETNNVPEAVDPVEEELTDKLDRLVGGKTISEEAPEIPRGPRGARAAALQALYEEDMTGHPAVRVLHSLPTYIKLSVMQAKKAEAITRFASTNRAALDRQIATVAKEFPVDQLGTVDRNILRIALAELDPEIDTPQAVAVNEAVELAKLFGSDSTPGFVNGVLGALLR